MKYKSFYEYARDKCWERVKPRDWWGSRMVIKVDQESITHIGDIRIEGSLPIEHFMDLPRSDLDRTLVKVLNTPFNRMVINEHISPRCSWTTGIDSMKWAIELRASSEWNWRSLEQWNMVELPITIYESGAQININKVDFKLKKTVKREMPDDIVRKMWYNIQKEKPYFWFGDLGGRHLHESEKWRRVRLGIQFRRLRSVEDFWDLPSDSSSVPNSMRYWRGKNVWAFCLPFISVYASHSSIAMPFSGDEFLPNPQKRRDLFNLIKKRESDLLDAHFNEQTVVKKSWGNENYVKKIELVGKSMSSLDLRWLKVKAITAHQPNSILGSILTEENKHLIEFTLKYFTISASELNHLQVGRCWVVEHLARNGRLSFVSHLVQGEFKLAGDVWFNGKQSFQRTWSVVFAAVELDNVEYLKDAIANDQKGKLLNLRAHRGVTALGVAVMGNKIEHVSILIDAQADVNQLSWGDETVLCLGLQFGASLEIIQKLVQAGADISGKDLTGNCIRSQLEARRLLG